MGRRREPDPGTWLHTSAGTWIQITAVREWTQSVTVHNLTVKDIHTYHVQADSGVCPTDAQMRARAPVSEVPASSSNTALAV